MSDNERTYKINEYSWIGLLKTNADTPPLNIPMSKVNELLKDADTESNPGLWIRKTTYKDAAGKEHNVSFDDLRAIKQHDDKLQAEAEMRAAAENNSGAAFIGAKVSAVFNLKSGRSVPSSDPAPTTPAVAIQTVAPAPGG